MLPNVSPNSVIVMDNASYHSVKLEKIPTLSWRKSDLRDWLIKQGVQPQDNLLKAELHELAKKLDITTTYVIDSIAEEAGHQVLRFPPYHCQYNPIELIWARVKGTADLRPLVLEAIKNVTPENWKAAVGHAEQLQTDDAARDIVIDRFIDSFIITLTSSSSDEDSS